MASVYQIEFGKCISLINRSLSTFFCCNQAGSDCLFRQLHTKLGRICCLMVLCSNAMAACHSWQHRTFTKLTWLWTGTEMSIRQILINVKLMLFYLNHQNMLIFTTFLNKSTFFTLKGQNGRDIYFIIWIIRKKAGVSMNFTGVAIPNPNLLDFLIFHLVS